LEECGAVVPPHRRDVAEVGRHAFPVNHECKVCREKVLANAIAVETGHLCKSMDELVREANVTGPSELVSLDGCARSPIASSATAAALSFETVDAGMAFDAA
jgi:hypothetical protein